MFIKRTTNSSLEKNEENSDIQKTLPKFTPVMVSDHLSYGWRLGFYNRTTIAYDTIGSSLENASVCAYAYIIPLDKFKVDLKTNQIVFDSKDNYGITNACINNADMKRIIDKICKD